MSPFSFKSIYVPIEKNAYTANKVVGGKWALSNWHANEYEPRAYAINKFLCSATILYTKTKLNRFDALLFG